MLRNTGVAYEAAKEERMLSIERRITQTERSIRVLRSDLDDIADEIAAVKDQVKLAELRAHWRKLVSAMADAVLEADEKLQA